MQTQTKMIGQMKHWGLAEVILIGWVVLGLVSLYPVAALLQASFPIFTILWLGVPLVVVLRSKAASQVGFSSISRRDFTFYSAVYLFIVLTLMLIFEPWSHTYAQLVAKASAAPAPDPTFAWIIRFPGWEGWAGMFFFSGLVTIFAEELFFRGWLLQWLQRRMKPFWVVILQASLFTLPQMIAALLLSPLQAVLYTLVYSWLAIGITGGWVALRTQSIWPSLIGAVLCNLVLTAFVIH